MVRIARNPRAVNNPLPAMLAGMSTAPIGLPLYHAAMAAVDAAIAEAQSILAGIDQIEDKELALRLCVQTVQAFNYAERAMYAIRVNSVTHGCKLWRKTVREGAA